MIANLFQENVQLRMRVWVYSNLKQWNKDIVKNVLEGCHNPHFLVDIVQPWKLEHKIKIQSVNANPPKALKKS